MEQFTLNLQLLDRRFEDSMELLLELIKVNKINIFDIPIAEVTRQFIAYIEHYHKVDPDYASEFLVLAATLMYIKSRMLLPSDTELLEDDMDDPRYEIVQQLLEYQKYKQAAEALEEMEESFTIQRDTAPLLCDIKSEEQWKEATLNDLLKAFKKIMTKPRPDMFLKRPRARVSIEEIMQEIRKKLLDSKKISFNEFFADFYWIEIIVAFISILELVRLQEILLKQQKTFEDIFIFKKDASLTNENNEITDNWEDGDHEETAT